jgi:hypothetical protein
VKFAFTGSNLHFVSIEFVRHINGRSSFIKNPLTSFVTLATTAAISTWHRTARITVIRMKIEFQTVPFSSNAKLVIGGEAIPTNSRQRPQNNSTIRFTHQELVDRVEKPLPRQSRHCAALDLKQYGKAINLLRKKLGNQNVN